MTIECDRCQKELTEPGALLFGPPQVAYQKTVARKIHLCKRCYEDILPAIEGLSIIVTGRLAQSLVEEALKQRVGDSE